MIEGHRRASYDDDIIDVVVVDVSGGLNDDLTTRFSCGTSYWHASSSSLSSSSTVGGTCEHPCPLGNDDACPMGQRCYAGVTCRDDHVVDDVVGGGASSLVVVDENDDGNGTSMTFEERHVNMEYIAMSGDTRDDESNEHHHRVEDEGRRSSSSSFESSSSSRSHVRKDDNEDAMTAVYDTTKVIFDVDDAVMSSSSSSSSSPSLTSTPTSDARGPSSSAPSLEEYQDQVVDVVVIDTKIRNVTTNASRDDDDDDVVVVVVDVGRYRATLESFSLSSYSSSSCREGCGASESSYRTMYGPGYGWN